MSSNIVRIETAGPDRRARRLFFSDSDEPLTTAAAVLRKLSVAEGDSLDLAELAEAEVECARDRALRVLGYRERSVHELTKRLADDGYSRETVSALITRFLELGLLDDERFADVWARSKAMSGIGPRRIERELVAKGVDRQLAADAVDKTASGEDVIEMARAILGGRFPQDRSERDKALRKLVRRGFDLETARRALQPPTE